MRKSVASLWVLGVTAITAAVLFVLPITPKVAVETVPITRGRLIHARSIAVTVTHREETPVVTWLAGRVAEVCVRQGEAVAQGQLLLRLDTSVEEATLRQIARLRAEADTGAAAWASALGGSGDERAALQPLTGAGEVELLARAEECRQSIAAKQVRATQGGVAGQVYARQGAFVAAGTVALSVHQPGVQATAVQPLQSCAELALGTHAVLAQEGASAVATLCAFGEPTWEDALGGYVQTLTFDVAEDAPLRVGRQAEADMLLSVREGVPVAPLSALTARGTLWVAREGKAYEERVDAAQRDAEFVLVPERLLGCAVILEPNEDKLYPGAPVKERRR